MRPAHHVGESASQMERQERLSVLDKIVTCLETKKPSWQKARILHLSTQLEDSMFNATESMANYRDESTLPARITQHCRLLAASKTANKPPAAATGDGGHSVRSFPATPESSGAILDDGHGYVKASAPGSLSSFGRRTSSNFVLGPLPDPTARASQLAGAGGRGGAGGGRDSAGSGTVPYVLASDGTGSVRGNIASVRVPLSAMATTAAAAGHASVLAGDGNQGLNRSLAFSPLGAPTMGNCQQQQQKGQREGIAGVEEMSGNGMVMQRRETFLVSDDNSRVAAAPAIQSLSPLQPRTPPPPTEQAVHGSNVPHGSHSSPGETTGDDTDDDDDEDEDDTDGDKGGEADVSAAAALGSGTVSGAQELPPPGSAAAAAAAAAAAVEGGTIEEEEEEDEEQAHVNAVIAAASRGGWSGGEGGVVEHVSESEGGHQYPSLQQHHPKATEAEVKQHALRLLQSRLLLLTHAATCVEEEGSCPLAPLCGSVRQLLGHMQSCEHKKSCEFPHCASSKAVLQHKRMCKDAACGLCGSVRDLSQKCFWANARHLHKRRLEESHEQRRKKRQSEGKAVTPPRKLQAEKTKGGRESCFGLDEQGNHLGDITLGFFLRQDKAVKARKALRSQGETAGADNDDIDHIVADTLSSETLQQQPQPYGSTASTSGNPSTPVDVHHDAIDIASVGEKRTHDGDTKARASPLEGLTSPDLSVPPPPDQIERPRPTQSSVSWSSLLASSSPAAAAPEPAWPSSEAPQQPPLTGGADPLALATAGHHSATAMVTTTNAQDEKGTAEAGGATDEGLEELDPEGMSGGGPEARGLRATSGDYACDDYGGGDGRAQHHGTKAVAGAGHYGGAGGMTVAIPSLGGCGGAEGHLRSPSEIMLDEIAESLADTSRKPSFARMQSVQAFLDGHVELRQNASFGDVSAMVEQWMSLEDNTCPNNSHGHNNNNGSSSNVAEEEGAFSF